MTGLDVKEDLHSYLRGARETLVWKLDGLDEYDTRRPLTPTGTNLLGLVKHSASTHVRYGRVPWWNDSTVTLHRVLVHVTAETQRHAGHADIVRELIDGSAGLLEGFDNLHIRDQAGWDTFRDRIEKAARLAGGN